MARSKQGREVVYVERGGDASATGEETRRVLQRKLWKLRAVTEEKLDELAQQFGSGKAGLEDLADEEDDDLEEAGDLPSLRPRASGPSAREELERRLAESRARRRAVGDFEEPLA